MKRLLSKLKNKDSFLSNITKLTSGTVIAQAITIAVSPVITRLYSPSEMGAQASFLAVVGIIGVIAAGRYELAVILPDNEHDATSVAWLGIGIAAILGASITLVFILFGRWLAPLLGMNDVPIYWTYILGIIIFFTGLQNVLTRTSIRDKKYGILASTQVTQTFIASSVKIGLGYLNAGVAGLFAGTLTSYITRSIRLSWEQRSRLFNKTNWPSKKDLFEQAKRYKKFPLISSWSAFLNTASTQIPIILFASLFSPAVAGYYALSHRILNMPMLLIGKSVGDVFFERAARARYNENELARITLSIYKKLLFIGTVTMSFVTFYGDILFPFVFGNSWIVAGKYAQWISLAIIFQLAISPISSLFTILERQWEGLFWSLFLVTFRVLSIILFSIFFESELFTIKIFSVINMFCYISFSLKTLYIARIPIGEFWLTIVKIVIPIFLIQYFIFVGLSKIF